MKNNWLTSVSEGTTVPAVAYLRGLQEGNTRDSMRRALQRIAELISPGSDFSSIPWHQIRYEHAADIRQRLTKNFAPQTANQSIVALRGVLRASYFAGLMDEREYTTASSIKSVRGTRPMSGRYVTKEELDRLLGTCDITEIRGARDAAMIVLLFCGAGLRRSELGRLSVQDYNRDRHILKVYGKGNRVDVQVLSPEVTWWIDRWLEKRGASSGALFPGLHFNGSIRSGKGLTGYGVYVALQKRAEEAGIKHISPHDARRTFISNLFDEGVDISTAQVLARHSNPSMTTRYDRRGERAQRAAVEALYVPDSSSVKNGVTKE